MDPSKTLRAQLSYQPQELKFGTSGRRGELLHLTQLEIYINALAELRYLQSLPASAGGIRPGEEFYFAYDLRPSSTHFMAEPAGRGEIAQAVVRAIRDAGMMPVNLGPIPTPALTYFALSKEKGSIMVTGSHIPFDRNGYKLNTACGELLKEHEGPIHDFVRKVREEIYGQDSELTPFTDSGRFKDSPNELPRQRDDGRVAYLQRYTNFFAGESLSGKRILVYQHSAVGRDLLVELLSAFGAEVIPVGRSDRFVPIDTENIGAAELDLIQQLTTTAARESGSIHAVISTDGDSDRPLVLDVDRPTTTVRFFGGDLLGIIVAEFLQADAVVVPISSNDAIDRGNLAPVLEPKTKIGSPYVIAGMERARQKGKSAICGWEANGGFLTGSDIRRNRSVLTKLATRDAMLPILSVLFCAQRSGVTLSRLFDRLPKRYSRAALIKNCPRSVGLRIVTQYSPGDPEIQDVVFQREHTSPEMESIRKRLQAFFPAQLALGTIARLNYTDGVRITFSNGEVAHLRPSGNADEFRVYAVADQQERADAIAEAAVAEPDGVLRTLQRAAE